MNRQTEKTTALYSRLSRDDDHTGDSGSIVNQKAMLEKYAEQNGFSNVAHFCDDGFSGKDFDRPDWKRMIDEVENGSIGTIIVKDMSRVGRDYLQTGYFTEVFFREKGVRFIAISNSIDSQNSESSEFAPFLNIMSEWYLRDISRKVKAGKRAAGMSGKRLTTKPIYGYMLDPDDKTKWIIDPEAAEIVRRIFSLTIEGKGVTQIANTLTREKIERPTYYQYTRGIVNYSNADHSDPYFWVEGTVGHILKKMEYMGHTVNFSRFKDSYKDKQSKERPKDEWVIFENTHPAIIDPETWETAQRCRKTVRRTDTTGEPNPLTGLIFCADCGAKLYNHRAIKVNKGVSKKTGEMRTTYSTDSYTCATHNLGRRVHGVKKCSAHYISTKALKQLILDAIRSMSEYVKSDETEFLKRMRETSAVRQEETVKAHKKRINKERQRINELHILIRRIYEDYVSEKVSYKRFELLSAEYEREQEELEKSVTQLIDELEIFDADSVKAEQFIGLVRRYTEFSELTPAMLAEFVEKIIVYEADKSNGEREQAVDIYLSFIGRFDVPMPEPTPEEVEAENQARMKRSKLRENQRKYVEKRMQQTAAMSA